MADDFLRKVHKMKIILIIFAAIVLFVTVSFVRHKVCSSKEMDLLTPLGELVEVNGHNMSVYTEGTGDKTFCVYVRKRNMLAYIGF